MISNLLSKYVWLAETIYSANGITFAEINQKWLDNDLSEGINLSKRTFQKWKIAIEELFGLIIDCERKNGYRFVIRNKEDLHPDNLTGWLFRTLTLSSKLERYKSLGSYILLEDIFVKEDLLTTILEAIRNNTTLLITYKSFYRDEATSFEVEPYCLKIFQQRWYLIAKSSGFETPRIYALDRIVHLQPTGNPFTYPKDFSPARFFASSYGVIVDETIEAENIELKIGASQVPYLRSLPLHHSQQEVEQTEKYTIFRLRMAPTFDFEQQILSLGEYVEVLSPLWFRERMVHRIEKMMKQYK